MRRLAIAIAAAVVLPACAARAEVPRFDLPPADAFGALAARPPFSPERRAAPEAPPAEAAATVAAGSFVVVGVAGEAGGRAVAVLRREDTGQELRVAAGDRVNGWRVARVGAGTLVLEAAGREHTAAVAERLPPPP